MLHEYFLSLMNYPQIGICDGTMSGKKRFIFFTDEMILQQAALHLHDNIDKTRRERMAEDHKKEVPQMTRVGQPTMSQGA